MFSSFLRRDGIYGCVKKIAKQEVLVRQLTWRRSSIARGVVMIHLGHNMHLFGYRIWAIARIVPWLLTVVTNSSSIVFWTSAPQVTRLPTAITFALVWARIGAFYS